MIPIRSITKNVRIKEVDDNIFTRNYLGHCLDCLVCQDICCSYGSAVDKAEQNRILVWAPQLEARLEVPSSQWFESMVTKDSDYPSGEVVRTKTYRGKCIFYHHGTRGCTLHSFAIERGMDWHQLKPAVCSIFPFTWERGRLFVSSFLDELPCRDQGVPVFQAQRDELQAFLGNDLIRELEEMASQRNLIASWLRTP